MAVASGCRECYGQILYENASPEICAAESDKIVKRRKPVTDQRRKRDFLCGYRSSRGAPSETRVLSVEGTTADSCGGIGIERFVEVIFEDKIKREGIPNPNHT